MSNKRFSIIILISALVIGFVSGIGGSLVLREVSRYVPLVQGVVIDDTQQQNRGDIVIRDPRKVVVQQDVELQQVADRLRVTTARFFRSHQKDDTVLSDILVPTDYVGQGAALTSDGWLVTARSVHIDPATMVAAIDKQIYGVQQVIADPLSGLQFVKVQAANLSVVSFAERTELAAGQELYGTNGYPNGVAAVHIQDPFATNIIDRTSAIRSSEGLDTAISVAGADAASIGAPFITLKTELAGILVSDARGMHIVPAAYIDAMSKSITRSGKISRPYLGVSYVNLDQTPGAVLALAGQDARGAYVTAKPGAQSPAAGQLHPGDRIISVEEQDITRDHDLQDFIREYQPGAEISLTISDGKQAHTLSVKLGTTN